MKDFTVALIFFAITVPAVARDKPPVIVVTKSTIVAFFPPVTQSDLKNGDTNESLADFQYYAGKAQPPLQKNGIEFQELYAYAFRFRIGSKVKTFRPGKTQVGYYLVAPGKKLRIVYGVMTDDDLLQIAKEYFVMPSK